jgi:hypothetical protein
MICELAASALSQSVDIISQLGLFVGKYAF